MTSRDDRPAAAVAATPDEGLGAHRAWIDALLARMHEGVVVAATDGTVRFANPLAHQLLDAQTAEALQLGVLDLLDRMGSNSKLEIPASESHAVVRVERRRFGPSGQILFLQDDAILRTEATELLLANRMRGLENLYRAMAHDLKSPLQAVALNLDLIRTLAHAAGLDDDDREKLDAYLDVSHGELARLGRSIQSVLSQAATSASRPRRIDLRRIQREVVTLVRPLARRKRITVKAFAPRRSVLVLGRRDRLKQAVLNLAFNAIEAMDKGGSLEFRVKVRDDGVGLQIADDGPGIPGELEARVFEPHFTTKKTGNGIGLSVARDVAKTHGGELVLERRRPNGTVARLQLPAAPRS